MRSKNDFQRPTHRWVWVVIILVVLVIIIMAGL